MVRPQAVEGLTETNKVARDQTGTLMDELVIGMLAIGPRLAPNNRPGLISDRLSVEVHTLPIALHIELLTIGAQTPQVLVIGQDGVGLSSEKVGIPHPEQPEDHRQVFLERRGSEVFIHSPEPGQHASKVLRADPDHE